MAKTTLPNPKLESLRQQASLNPRPDTVQDSLFISSDFFDVHDLVQVKYEMLRRVHHEGESITEAAKAFGFSRPTFYEAREALEQGGLPGLVPKKRGPRRAHKLSKEIVEFLQQQLSEDSSLRSPELARRVQEKFGVRVHPRSVERALTRLEKKQT
jgi:transposase